LAFDPVWNLEIVIYFVFWRLQFVIWGVRLFNSAGLSGLGIIFDNYFVNPQLP